MRNKVSDEEDDGDTVGSVLRGFLALRKRDPVTRNSQKTTLYIYQVAYRVHLLQPFETAELSKESHIKGEAALCYHLQHWV